MQESTELLVTPKLFEQIVKAEGNLVGIETPNVDETIAQFRQLAIRSGQSVYLWDPENGIAALRESEMRVPGSKRFPDALRFILQSVQFGVYLLRDFEPHVRPPNTALLQRIARIRTDNERKLVFLAQKLALPQAIDALVERMNRAGDTATRPRLRDGRWVTA
ncbi:hypothetical protein [Dokdonella sp.]|uniref:hypothetical protein n=1 Tax=Dokdonella sp. TaxID=2291710 RepID=UPI0025C1F3D7|nr:hypothetical protein [Dokdonella sp.]MBX3693265.1 hypothetical protein [Dokdonella sp.]MCW5567771.1 hypothetical protein [Dokdonella sp.]